MVELVPASKLRPGDVFSTDGYAVEVAVLLSGGGVDPEVAVYVVKEGHQKFAYLSPERLCPIWRESV
jgi:hypothetical protein